VALPDAIAAFRKATLLDPSCAPAHAGLALAHCLEGDLRTVPHAQAYAAAKTSALRAVAMESGAVDAQVALGTVLFLSEFDWAAAERTLHRALAFDPRHIAGLLRYGALKDALGESERALGLKQQALALMPTGTLALVSIAKTLWNLRRYDEAITYAQQALAAEPRLLVASELVSQSSFMIADYDRFAAERQRRAEIFGVNADQRRAMALFSERLRDAHAHDGKAGAAKVLLEHFVGGEDSRAVMVRASLYGTLGNYDAAFADLDRAIALRDPELVYLAVAPHWEPLRQDPRFVARLRRMGLS
jgi:tetratricopeptide (TPR) repeat protein